MREAEKTGPVGRPPVWKGSSGEERQLAQLLDDELKQAGLRRAALPDMLRPEQFASGRVPSQATIYRRLQGVQLAQDAEFIDAVIELLPERRRGKARGQTYELLERHRDDPTTLPPSPEQLDKRIETLRSNLAQARDEKAALDEKIAAIEMELQQEVVRRAEAEQVASALTPVDPEAEAEAMIERLAGLRASGQDAEAERLIVEFTDDGVPTAVLVALLKMLEKRRSDDAHKLATAVADRRYYRLLPEMTKGLDRAGATSSWYTMLRAAGARCYDEAYDWLVDSLPTREYAGAVWQLLYGAAQGAGTRAWRYAKHIAKKLDEYSGEEQFLRETARERPTGALVEIIHELKNSYYDDRSPARQLLRLIGKERSPELLIEVVDGLRTKGGDSTAEADLVLRAAGEDRSLGGIAALLAAFRDTGREDDVYKVIDGMVADPDAFVKAVKGFREIGVEKNIDDLFSRASRLSWRRRSSLTRALRKECLEDDARKTGASLGATVAEVFPRVRKIFAVFATVLLVLFLLAALVLFVGMFVAQKIDDKTTIESEDFISGDRPTPCLNVDCNRDPGFGYTIQGGSSVHTEFAIRGDLRHMTATLRLAQPQECDSTVRYTLSAGNSSISGQIEGNRRKDISLQTDGATALVINVSASGSSSACNPTLGFTDPAMHRIPWRWLQVDLSVGGPEQER